VVQPGRGPRLVAAVTVAAAVGAIVVVPLLGMGRTVWAEGRDQLDDILSSPGLGAAVAHTFGLAATVTVLASVLGTALALGLRRPNVPGRAVWRVAVLVPVLVPDFVLAYSWLRAYGRAGFTADLFGWSWAGVQGPAGVTAVVAVNAVPIVYLITTVGLAARAEPALERAARVSGASATTVLWTVTLPLLRPALVSAAVLVFVLTLGSFGIPQVLGAPTGFSTVTTRIYANLAQSSEPSAFVEAVALALLLVFLAGLVAAPADAVLSPRLRVTRTATTEPTAMPGRRLARRSTAAAVAAYLLLTSGWPLLALVSTAVTRAVGLAPGPANWTLDNFRMVLTARNGEALVRSLLLAAGAAFLLVLLGGCVAALERSRAGRSLGTLVTLTLVLPGSTLAIGLLISYGRWLADTALIILLAYLGKLWAVAHRPISGALDRLPPDELRAARISGATLLTAGRTVVLPPLRPALVAAWLVCFLTALHEVTMSSLLYGPGSETLAVVVLNSAELGRVGVTAALAVGLTAVVLIPGLLLWGLSSRRRRSRRA
jgi:iron(III) transport system permease protein